MPKTRRRRRRPPREPQFHFRLPEELKDELRELAEREGISMQALLTEIVRRSLIRRREGGGGMVR